MIYRPTHTSTQYPVSSSQFLASRSSLQATDYRLLTTATTEGVA